MVKFVENEFQTYEFNEIEEREASIFSPLNLMKLKTKRAALALEMITLPVDQNKFEIGQKLRLVECQGAFNLLSELIREHEDALRKPIQNDDDNEEG